MVVPWWLVVVLLALFVSVASPPASRADLLFFNLPTSFPQYTITQSRTGDHLVGWANSSLRPLHALPPLPKERLRGARGVVLADPLSAAWQRDDWERVQRAATGGDGAPYEPSRTVFAAATTGGGEDAWQTLAGGSGSSTRDGDSGGSSSGSGASTDDGDWGSPGAGAGDWAAAATGMVEDAAAAAAAAAMAGGGSGANLNERLAAAETAAERDLRRGLEGGGGGGGLGGALGPLGGAAVPPPEARARRVAEMLARLSSLPWRRVDVSFQGATWGFGAPPYLFGRLHCCLHQSPPRTTS